MSLHDLPADLGSIHDFLPSTAHSRMGSDGEALPDPTVGAAQRFRASIFSTLRAELAHYRTAPARATLRLCMAAAAARALRVPYWMAYSQRDYAAAVLGVKHSNFCLWAKLGALFWSHPALREEFLEGRVNLRQLEKACSAYQKQNKEVQSPTNAEAAEPSSHAETTGLSLSNEETEPSFSNEAAGLSPTADFVCLSIVAPTPAILYMEDSMRLGRAQVGVSQGDEDALSALLAEASADMPLCVDAATARRRFRVRDKHVGCRNAQEGCGDALEALRSADSVPTDDAATDIEAYLTPSADSPLARLDLRHLGEAAQRKAALRVHALLVRLLARRDQLEFRLEDQLLEWAMDGVHQCMAFRNFECFAREILDLAPSTCNDRLSRARLRRQEHPIAVARRAGEITAVQTTLLERIHRRCHVPPSNLDPWIHYATQHTVRGLGEAGTWAWRQVNLDYRKWSLAGCAPPDADQLQTADQSLDALVRRPGGDALNDALLEWNAAPTGVFRLRVSRETRDELLSYMASLQDEMQEASETPVPRRIPPWFALCRIFHQAREAWDIHHQSPAPALRRILDRDGYRCAAPECTQRRNLHVHHVDYRSHGGGDEDSNRVTLCAFHHQLGEHGGLMRVRGKVDDHGQGLTWEMGLDGTGRAQLVFRNDLVLSRTRPPGWRPVAAS